LFTVDMINIEASEQFLNQQKSLTQLFMQSFEKSREF